MPRAVIDGVGLDYLDVGEGFPMIWCHEATIDQRGWLPQVHFFSRRYRVITFNARGYPPSDIPTDPEAYSQDIHASDVIGILDHLGLEQAFVGGLSMGGTTALQVGLSYPDRVRGMIIGSAGSGTVDPESALEGFLQRSAEIASDPTAIVRHYGNSPGRHHLRRKDPLMWQEFEDAIHEHSQVAWSLMIKGVQARRPTIAQLEPQLRALNVPALILVGDEDEPCLEPGVMLKRWLPNAGLFTFPQSGHSLNLEEPDLFNRVVLDFCTAVEAGTWRARPE